MYVAEYNKFKAQRLSYPHQQYIHYEPEEEGYILSSDKRFLEKIYRIHGDVFTQSHLLKDATDDTKNTIYGFIQAASSIVFAVDCENSDPYKFYGAFKSLRKEILSSVKKIMLFDDIHTASAWKMLERFIDVPIEYIEVERINSSKSLVDMEMAVSVTKEAMCNGTDAFILCSSDSDFGGLIRCVQEAKFLVLYEHEKCGSAIKDAWIERGVPHFALDDFSSSNAGELKTEVLLEELRERVKDTYNVFSRTAMELTQDVFQATYAGYNQQEMKEFCEEYVKTLKLCVDEEDGRFFIKTK